MVVLKLIRRGRRNLQLYDIIAANKRAKCNGKFLEKLGTYDPTKDVSSVILFESKVMKWLKEGAQVSDTVRSILSKAGIMLKWHLEQGIMKNKISEQDKNKKIEDWSKNKSKYNNFRIEIR